MGGGGRHGNGYAGTRHDGHHDGDDYLPRPFSLFRDHGPVRFLCLHFPGSALMAVG
jgi:hypothetical protein